MAGSSFEKTEGKTVLNQSIRLSVVRFQLSLWITGNGFREGTPFLDTPNCSIKSQGIFSLHASHGVIPPGDEDMERGEEEVEGVSGMN